MIVEFDLQDSNVFHDSRCLSKTSVQINRSEAVGEISDSSVDDDVMELIFLDDLRERVEWAFEHANRAFGSDFRKLKI